MVEYNPPPSPPKRKPGRPPGARNRPKPERELAHDPDAAPDTRRTPDAEASPAPHPVPGPGPAAAAGAPHDTASLLAYHQASLEAIGTDLARIRASKDPFPRDITQLLAAQSRELKQIATLTGAEKVTEAKLLASDVWLTVFNELVTVLMGFPDALAACETIINARHESLKT